MFGFKKPTEKESFGPVAERELPVLYRVAKRLTLNGSDAEELVGQTLLKAATHWDSFDGRHPRSWLIQILRNEWLHAIRRRKSRGEIDIDAVAEPEDSGFWQAVDHQMEAKLILGALEKLPEEYRLAVSLCDVEEMSYEEAAESLGVPVGTIRSRLFRGRKILRSRLVSLQAT